MFEIEKMEQEFDYSLVDNETADFLRSCEYEMNGIAEDARVKFGGVLKKAQERLAKDGYGCFLEWVKSGGISKDDAYYYIELNRLSLNLERQKTENFLNAPKSLQKEVMKKNAPEDMKQKVYEGDITTHKEYKDMMKERDEAEQRAKQAEQQAEQAKKQAESERKERERLEEESENIEPQIKEVIKEVDKTDYQKIKKLEKQIESMKENNKSLDEKEKEVKLLQLDASKSVLQTKISIDDFLEEVAFNSYRRGAIASSSEGTKKKLQEGIDDLQNFINEMEMALNGTIEQ